MDRVGYTAMTAAHRSMLSLQVHANNLANANTPGFRADLERAQAVAVQGYGYDSRHLALVGNAGVNLAPGPLVATGRDLDVAIQGEGLFVVEYGDGEAYTRHGSLQLDADGRLTINGRQVMGEGGPIVVPPHERISIGRDGVISIKPVGENDMVELERLRLVRAPAAELTKNADGLLVRQDGTPAEPAAEAVVMSGFLESSNVSVIEELTATMSLNRLFETQVKMMKAAEDLAEAGNRMIRGG